MASMTPVTQTQMGGCLPMRGGSGPALDVRNQLRVSTWNVLTLAQPGFPGAVVSQLAAY